MIEISFRDCQITLILFNDSFVHNINALGQAVPAGSHVRLNLQTGQREVKLGEKERLKYLRDGNGYSSRRYVGS